MPSERELARRWATDHTVVNRAATRLIGQGVLVRRNRKLYRSALARLPENLGELVIISRDPADLKPVQEVAELYHARVRHLSVADPSRTAGAVREAVDAGAAGILINAALTPGMRRLLQYSGIPAVVCAHHCSEFDSFDGDVERSAEIVFRELEQRGVQSITALAAPPQPQRKFRQMSYDKLKWLCEVTESVPCHFRSVSSHGASVTAAVKFALKQAGPVWGIITQRADLLTKVHAALDRLLPDRDGRVILACAGSLPKAWVRQGIIGICGVEEEILRMAGLRLCKRIIQKDQGLPQPPPAYVRLIPNLAQVPPSDPQETGSPQTLAEELLDAPLPERQARTHSFNAWVYPRTPHAGKVTLHPLDLTPQTNRSLWRKNGWLSKLPLRGISPGRHVIHGIPFEVAENSSGEPAAVVLGRRAPRRLSIPLNMVVRDVYFLHGCGFTTPGQAFAEYQFISKGKLLQTQTLSTLQLASHDPEDEGVIQDWWPQYPQKGGANFYPFLVTQNDDPLQYERYLYTLRCPLPTPTQIEEIRIVIKNSPSATLGILGITLAKV